MAETQHYRQALNNYLQQKYGNTNMQEWLMSSTGPQHSPTWTAIMNLNGLEWGRGQGGSIGSAKEDAARAALQQLGLLR